MYIKNEFIGSDFSCSFLQVGIYDEEELIELGQSDAVSVSLELDAIRCLRFFPQVENLILRPGCIDINDLHYLSKDSIKRLKLDYYSETYDEYSIDLSIFSQLEVVFSRTQYNFTNTRAAKELKQLVVQQWYDRDLSSLVSPSVVCLKILEGKLRSVCGIQQLPQLSELSISNQRLIRDLSQLAECKQLQILELESCNAISLETMPMLPYIKRFTLIGRQCINSAMFFSRFPNMEELFLGVRINDGDLSPLFGLRHCVLLSEHSHYSHRNLDLPKK